MTDHPLTDEKCNKLSIFDLDECSAAYAYGIMADMRTATDWQLEQVIEYFKSEILEAKCGFIVLNDERLLQFEKAMRPPEES